MAVDAVHKNKRPGIYRGHSAASVLLSGFGVFFWFLLLLWSPSWLNSSKTLNCWTSNATKIWYSIELGVQFFKWDKKNRFWYSCFISFEWSNKNGKSGLLGNFFYFIHICVWPEIESWYVYESYWVTIRQLLRLWLAGLILCRKLILWGISSIQGFLDLNLWCLYSHWCARRWTQHCIFRERAHVFQAVHTQSTQNSFDGRPPHQTDLFIINSFPFLGPPLCQMCNKK